jgi:hypothetical protein
VTTCNTTFDRAVVGRPENARRRAAYIAFVNSSWGRSSVALLPSALCLLPVAQSLDLHALRATRATRAEICFRAASVLLHGADVLASRKSLTTRQPYGSHEDPTALLMQELFQSSPEPLGPCWPFAVLFAICITVQCAGGLKQRTGRGLCSANFPFVRCPVKER